MKTKFFLKTLLVAVCLLVGSNVWADVVETTVVNCNFESGETLFSATKDPGGAARITVSNAGEESAHYVNFANGKNASNGNAIATYNFNTLTSDASAVDIEFDAYLSAGSPNYHHLFTIGDASQRAHTSQKVNNSGAIFTFGMKRGKWNGAGSNVNYWSINDAFTTNSEANFGKWLHVNVYVDLVNKKVTYSIKNQAQTETINSGTEIAFLDETASACTQIDFNSCLNYGTARVDNLVIKKYKDDSATATTYTVKYQDTNGTTLKEDAVYDIYVGNVYSASASDMATFYSNDGSKKYVYKSGQNTETEASETASENVITLVFDTYEKYDYTIYQKLGDNDATELSSGSKYSDETLTYYYPKCVKNGADYYVIDANGSEPLYGVTVSSSNTTPTITYTLDEDIVYYAECETLYGGTATYTYFEEKSSNGTSKAMQGNVFMKTSMNLAKDGFYNVTISGGNRDGGHVTTANLKLMDSSDNISEDNVITQYMTGSAWIGEMNANSVKIPAGSELYMANDNGGGVSKYVFDYIIVRRVADVIDINHEFVGAFDFSTTANGANSSDITLKKGETKVLTFQNHGQDFGKNWRITVKEGETWKANVCADSWDYTAGKATKVSYIESKDGGETKEALDWDDFEADMADARCVATLAYGLDGTLAITTTSTGEANGYIYYVDQDVTGLTGDLTINLSVNQSWLEILSEEQTAVSKTISAAGWATYCSPYALDFSGVEGLEAYVITGYESDPVLSLERVSDAPANVGVILKGDAGNYSIPVIASSDNGDATTGNKLVGVTASETLPAKEGYVLMNGANGVGFYKNNNDFTLGANTAYLPADFADGLAREFFLFEDDGTTTGIADVRSKMSDVRGDVFDLQGRKVAQPAKGLYIVNGKKVVIK